jgi:glycosyltransferase involved in cell wall biosynthesis
LKILFVHNNYASNNSGEEHSAEALYQLLTNAGHEVQWFRKSSDVIQDSIMMKFKAFFLGLYNPKAVKQLKEHLDRFKPDVIQIQNLYPLISPAVIKTIKKQGVPIVMRCPNYRLFCPTGLHLDGQGQICELCLSGTRELNCIKKNCENNWFKSIGYALRNYTARQFWGITKLVDAYIVQTRFQKQKFITNGIAEQKLFVVPGLTPNITTKKKHTSSGTMVSFIGRVSEEKGIREFIEAAKRLPNIPFKVIGSYSEAYTELKASSPLNVEWMGFIAGVALDEQFQDSRIVVVPGKWYEGFPNVITRAMKHGKPVVTSNLGAMASIIDHGKNGLLVPPGDVLALAEAIKGLYHNETLCKSFGKAAQIKAELLYTEEKVYQGLLNVYNYVTP